LPALLELDQDGRQGGDIDALQQAHSHLAVELFQAAGRLVEDNAENA